MTREAFLNAFFGPGNELGRPDVEEKPELQELVSGLTDDLDIPAILPRRKTSQEVEWFVLCGSEAELRRVQVELQGFVGPSYGRWDGARATLDPDDPVERAVNDFADGQAIRFRTTSDAEFQECWEALKLMRSVWRQRPAHGAEWIRTGAALVREFELAIKGGDAETAGEHVAELRRRGLVGPENIRFLEVRQKAAEGRWRDIAHAHDLPDLARIRRPWLVTEDLVSALYRVHLAPHEAGADVARAVEVCSGLTETLPALFTARGPLRSPDVVKAFALRHAVHGERERVAELGQVEGLQPADREWIEAIGQSLTGALPPTRGAQETLAEGDLDAAFRLAVDEPQSVGRVELLIECAFELQTLEAAAAALSALEDLDEPDRSAIAERRLIAVALEGLHGIVEPSEAPVEDVPRTWTSWLRRLLADPGWRGADAVAACGELEYSAEDILDPAGAERLAELVEEAAESERPQAFRDALPRIIGWLDRHDPDPATVRPVHQAILTVLAIDSAWGESSLEVAYNSGESLLRAGPDIEGYADLLEQFGLLWERMAARSNIAWLADVVELLELYPGPRDQLVGFVAAAAGRVLPFADRVDGTVIGALARSCAAVGATEVAEAIAARVEETETPAESAPADVLADRTVGIYTLTPQVGVRARDAIQRRFPGVRVELDSSHVSTPALENLAATADYLIVSIRSAKHAATDAIERHRPRDLPTLIPRGRGSSRMVEALVTAVEERA